MKKILYLPFLALVLVACGQSKEQKAEALIKESLKKYLYKPETYKPVETKIDSAFAPYDDPAFFEEIAELMKINSDYEDLKQEAKQAKYEMEEWSAYLASFGKNEYERAKEKYDDANAQMEKLKTKTKKITDKLKTRINAGRKFIGYKAAHNYRADNNAGETLIGNAVFFFDEKFSEVTFSMEAEGYNQIQEAIGQFEELIEEAKE